MKHSILMSLFCIFFLGCSATTGMSPTVDISGFDKSKVVKISLHSNDCNPLFERCTSMAAQWRSSNPDKALLIIQINGELLNIDSVDLNIDQQITTLRSENFTDHNVDYQLGELATNSSLAFLVDLELIRKLSTADFVWLRLNGYSEYFENRIAEGGKQGWAYHAMKRFIAKVDEVKGVSTGK